MINLFLRQRLLASLATLLTLAAVWAAAETARSGPESVIRERLEASRPGLPIQRVAPAEIEGMYRVELATGEMLHITADGRYLFGDLWEVRERDLVNLSELRRNDQRKALVAQLDTKDMVVFAPPAGGTRAVVNVFTDIDCGYCQKLHAEMAGYNALGIEIRYLAYPRAGIGSPSAAKLITAWCSENRQDALTRLKRLEDVPARTCDSPVEEDYALGQALGVNGTPALLLEDGRLVPGYIPPAELAGLLGLPVGPDPAG
jgi:thiol:disulfide interchange protein DsbC